LDGQHFNYKGGGVGGSFTSKGGTILITDDPIKNAEEALSATALKRAWDFLTGTFMSRVSAEGGEPLEILNMTRWAEKDPCGRFMEGKELYYLGDTPFEIDGQTFYFPHLWCFGKWLLLKMEVIEPNGEMLCPAIFGKGRYEDLEENMPEPILQANYHQKPLDIEGKLFKRSELQYFTLEEMEALEKTEAIEGSIAYCDVADEGEDSLSTPFGKIVGDKVYIDKVVFTKDPVEKSSLRVAREVYANKTNLCYFESNNGGKTFALLTLEKLEKMLDTVKEINSCVFKWRGSFDNKETRIFMQSEFIKKHVVFLHPSEYTKSSEYGQFMQEIWDYSAEGSNLHDDAPDSVHGLSKVLEMILRIKQNKASQKVKKSRRL
jgi:predicted phage terminase large subunit-like protein